MSSEIKQVVMIGLSDAGKTSFVHAVDELLHSPAADDALRADGLAPDRTYLQAGKEKFRKGEELGRTSRLLSEAPPELWFKDPRTGTRGRLFIPDLDGEIYRDQWVNRYWEPGFSEAIDKIDGILLFFRADQLSKNDEVLGKLIQGSVDKPETIPWDARKASAQVQLVDVLQFIARYGRTARPIRTAVLISAWDTVADMPDVSPDEFLKSHWALLDQFLACNADHFEPRVYGVSALGGSGDKLKALSGMPPADRVRCLDGTSDSKDLTRPVRWVLGLMGQE